MAPPNDDDLETLDDADVVEEPVASAGDTAVEAATIGKLGDLYSLESASTQAYDRALHSMTLNAYGDTLWLLRKSHAQRVEALASLIERFGGTRPRSLHISDSLRALVADVAASLSSATALAVLERCEDHGLVEYAKALRELGGDPRRLVEHLYPRQMDSRHAMQALNHGG